jgi:DNA polymerase-3 subunit delta'
MDFNQIIGHEKQINSLKNAIDNHSVSHSYLFEGEEGLGKRKVALAFSKTLLCKEEKNSPCNSCSSCIKFDRGNHPDFKELFQEKGLINLKQVEELVGSVSTSPFESKRKIFLIDDSHLMNLEGKNKLLKTLEEPPEFMNIILVTSVANRLLPTIVSRCQGIKFYPVDSFKIKELLVKEHFIEEDKAKFIAEFTRGSVGKSIELVTSENFFKERDETIKIIDSILKGDKTRALSSIDFFTSNKENIDEILDIILYWFRDILIYNELGESSLILNKDKIEILSSQSFLDLSKINDIIYRIEETKANIKSNVNLGLSLETMLLNIQEETR